MGTEGFLFSLRKRRGRASGVDALQAGVILPMSRRLLAATASLALVVSSFQPLAPHHVVTSPVFPNVRSTAAAPRVRHSTPIASSESDKVIEPSKDPAIKPGAKRAPVWSKGRSPDTNGGSNRGRGGGRGGRGGRGGGNSGDYAGGAGGSGLVIIRYKFQ